MSIWIIKSLLKAGLLTVLVVVGFAKSYGQNHRNLAETYLNTRELPSNANVDSVLSELRFIYDGFKERGEEKREIQAIICIGYLYASIPDYIESLKWFNVLVNAQYDLRSSDSFDLYYYTRDVYLKIKAYDKALETQLKLAPFYRRKNNEVRNIEYRTVAAKIYLGLHNYKRAIESYRNCSQLAEKLEYHHLKAMMNNDIGICFEKQKLPDSAIYYYKIGAQILIEKVLSNSVSLYDSFSLTLIEGNIAQVKFKQLNIFEGVEQALTNDLKLSKRIYDLENVIHTYGHLANFYYRIGDYLKSLECSNQAVFISKKLDVMANCVESFRQKGETFKKLNLNDSAAFYFKMAIVVNDSLNLVKTNMQIASMEVVYALHEKEEKLKKQILLNKATNSQLIKTLSQNQKTIIAIVVLSLSLILLYYAYYKRRLREKKLTLVYNEIENQKKIIEKTLAEKESLLKEIHHRVKNNLQVISSLFELQALRSDSDGVKKAIIEGQNRVKSMALIHQKLYQTEGLKDLPFRSYIQDLVLTLLRSYGKSENEISIEMDCDKASFNLDLAIPIGLITNELVSNSLKYAFDGEPYPTIVIVLRKLKDGYYLFKFSDNGKGLPIDFNIEQLDSLGMKLIKTLARQIEAEWSLTGTDGTVFVMKFKSKFERNE